MSRAARWPVVIVCVMLLAPGALVAQDDSRYWFSGGLGGSFFLGAEPPDDDPAVSVVAGLTYQTGRHLVSLRSSLSAQVVGEGVADVALLYGRSDGSDDVFFGVSFGPAWVDSGEPEGSAFGLALDSELAGRLGDTFALGVRMFGNVNSKRSFLALALSFQAGRLR